VSAAPVPVVTVAGARQRPWLWPLLIAGVAFALRLVLALDAPPWITWSDGRQYEEVALSLLRHQGYGMQTLRPPGYPTFMAAVWFVTGHDLRALRVVEAVLGAIAVGLIAWIGMRRFGRTAGLIAGAIAALHPVLTYLPSTQYTENTLVLLLVGAYGLLLAALEPGGRRLGFWAGAGALIGLGVLWRPNVVLLLPGLVAGAIWVLARARRPFVAPILCCLLGTAAVVAPWVVRCHQVHGRWYFIATGGGRALWLGNNPRLAHGPYTITFPPDPALAARLRAYPGEFEYDAALRREALANMQADPAGAVALYVRKLGHLYAFHPETYTPSRYMSDLGRLTQSAATAVLVAGALLGLAALRRTPTLVPLAVGALGFSLGSALFFAVMRYRMPAEPVLLWLSGIGWAGLPSVRRLGGR
jgi:hypothetical protein